MRRRLPAGGGAAAAGPAADVICVDPPRKGLAPDVVEAAASMEPERIVYVSCDPATLARDVARFAPLGYCPVRACAVDLVPRNGERGDGVSIDQASGLRQKCGIIERENYNKPKFENTKQPQCPPEKEKAITEALRHFGMI